MTLLSERISRSPTRTHTRQSPPKVLLGSHMPFVGVKMYALLTEDDVLKGRNIANTVGWRAAKRQVEKNQVAEKELVLV